MTVKTPQPGDLEAIETASRDELQALQLERLRWSLQHAYDNVPHYKAKFDEKGVHPSDLKTLADLARFPFTTKHDLRANYPFGMFAMPRQQLARIHASSGTTGKPTVVGYTMKDIDNWANLVARSIRAAGGRAGDLVHVAYGYGLFTGGLGAHYGAERLGCTVIPMSGGQTEKQVQLITDFKPDIIMVTPSYMQVLVEEFSRQGLDARESSLKVGIFGAEPWTEAMRRDIEASAGIDAVDIYGLSEVMGPGVASECIESKDGPVIWEDHFYPEIIDPDTGEVLPDGSEGELVFTSLSKEAMPVIRYRTRDLTRLLPPTSRSMRRMGKIVGRSDDMLIIRGVNLFPTQVEELVLQEKGLGGQYQLVVSRNGHLDELLIRCELALGAFDDGIGRRLSERIKNLIGVTATISVEPNNSIERTLVGKARRVVDQRKK
ncbi:MAG: phenylacetate--CoA ligase [Burkholderiales bacterium]|nr:phenylacetate--CoA ligase [Burkholderiales bacterium]